MLGQFDGKAFAPSTPKLPGNQGRGFYAAQTFSHAPKVRCIQIGWLRVPSPDMPFNQLMSLPQELSLRTTPEGPRLVRTPVPELASLRGAACDVAGLATFRAEQIEVRAEFGSEDADLVSIKVRGASISYDTKTQELSVLGRKVPAPMQNGKQRLAIYVDRTTIEVFASDGLIYVPLAFTPAAADQTVSAQVSGGKGKLGALQVYPLASAWGRD
jgi:sucrose-6-phosphate hydrolase SacC (GH32 family)